MSRWHSYLNSAKEILHLYKGEEPFASFIKKYFSAHKKFGASDRRQVSQACYSYFRLGKALRGIDMEERILTGLFLCSQTPDKLLGALRPAWNEHTTLPLRDKLSFLKTPVPAHAIFPWTNELSEGIAPEEFAFSHLQQPDLFLRIRPGNETIVTEKLEAAGIFFQKISGSCLALPNTSGIDKTIALDKEAVVQDLNSQRTGELLEGIDLVKKPRVWDCCTASGGKSIMTIDKIGPVELTVTDSRKSILVNLRKRFLRAGISEYQSFAPDLTLPLTFWHDGFDLIIADIPCSGSGTWGRTPEQLYYFERNKIGDYAALQQKIISTVVPHLKPGGFLLYITCSVFKQENEEQVRFIKEKFGLQERRQELLKGYHEKADTMFASLLQKPL
jgi:16S rRNA (cytosine967-C5)-methyltransferase